MNDISKIICKEFGLDTLNYFKNKQKGGLSNQKGSRYEDFFAIFKLAELFYLLLTNTQKDIEISTQIEAFIDDLLICDKLNNIYHYFQLKNIQKVDWGNSLKSIGDDFYKQKIVNDNLSIQTTKATLVCSNEKLVEKLNNSIPSNISVFSQVIFFPYSETLNHLLLSSKEFKETMELICFSNEIDKLEALATVMLGHWQDKKTTICSVKQLLSTLKSKHPNYLADTIINNKLLPEVESILLKIPDFNFKIEKGYFKWTYQNLESGEFINPVNSEEFLHFQRKVKGFQPRDFFELEGILL